MNTTDAKERDLETMRDKNYWYNLSTVQFASFVRYPWLPVVILGLNFIFFYFKLIIIHYQTQKQRKIKFKPRIKLNHNIYRTDTELDANGGRLRESSKTSSPWIMIYSKMGNKKIH